MSYADQAGAILYDEKGGNRMPSGFNCLTRFDRCRLQALKKSGFPQRAVAAEIGCPQSTAVRGPARDTGLRAEAEPPGPGQLRSGRDPRPAGHVRAARDRRGEGPGGRSASGTIIGVRRRGALVPLVDRAVMIHFASTGREKDVVLGRGRGHRASAAGKESAGHAEISWALGADFHFARPYCSRQRG